MRLSFTGTLEELQEKLESISSTGTWSQPNTNQAQFRTKQGGILNFYPATGTIYFQGQQASKDALTEHVQNLLATGVEVPDSPPLQGQTLEATPEDTEALPFAPTDVTADERDVQADFLGNRFADSELVIGLVGAVGTGLNRVTKILSERLKVAGYEVEEIRVSQDIIPSFGDCQEEKASDEAFGRISALMTAGDRAREKSEDILALGVAAQISSRRRKGEECTLRPRTAYIVNSLKHPAEVDRLREIYPNGFYLFGVHCDDRRRSNYLVDELRMTAKQAEQLMERDADEKIPHGQRTTATFHLSDFFVRIDGSDDQLKNCIFRMIDILMGARYQTPSFGEFAMFLAFSSALRSADLSRQVGAVVARDEEILATGANDSPKFGGGLYWLSYNKETCQHEDKELGRDYTRGEDSNKAEQLKIIEELVESLGEEGVDAEAVRNVLKDSRISDLTEFGRVVHAEMEALLCCARNDISTRGATLYCTTFPCHNCAKHIIAAGIKRVVYIEPYPKSKAFEFHSDSIAMGVAESKPDDMVHFDPFVGVGPRRFFDLFSMGLGAGYKLKRKDKKGQTLPWTLENGKLRVQMLPCSYIDLELVASKMFNDAIKEES